MDGQTSKHPWLVGRRQWLAAALGGVALLVLGAGVVAAAPSNDPVAKAQRVTFGQRMSGNVGATEQVGEPLPCGDVGSTVWYWIDAPGGRMSIDTAGSRYDTVVAVYRVPNGWSSGFGALSELACNDDGFDIGLDSYVEFDTRRGDRILVQVGGYEGDQGSFNLHVGRP